MLRRAIVWDVGDGLSPSFWFDVWLLSEPLILHASSAVPTIHLHHSVREYWDPHSGWKLHELSLILPPSLLLRLSTRQLCPPSQPADIMKWSLTTHGGFTVQSLRKTVSAPTRSWRPLPVEIHMEISRSHATFFDALDRPSRRPPDGPLLVATKGYLVPNLSLLPQSTTVLYPPVTGLPNRSHCVEMYSSSYALVYFL